MTPVGRTSTQEVNSQMYWRNFTYIGKQRGIGTTWIA